MLAFRLLGFIIAAGILFATIKWYRDEELRVAETRQSLLEDMYNQEVGIHKGR